MTRDLPYPTEEKRFRALLQKHIDKLDKARAFSMIDVKWIGQEAAEFAGLLERLSRYCDEDLVDQVSEAFQMRDLSFGFPTMDYRPMIIAQRNGASYQKICEPIIAKLKGGSMPGYAAIWVHKGKEPFLYLIRELCEVAWVRLPRAIEMAQSGQGGMIAPSSLDRGLGTWT